MPRLTKIYTRRGDDGTTGLGGGQRVPKTSLRVQAYGTVDELNSLIGLALAHGLAPLLSETLTRVQSELFNLGSDLCFIEEDKALYPNLPHIEQRHVDRLEQLIDQINEVVGALENFILPGGTLGSAQLHVARSVCRRAERDVLLLGESEPIDPIAIKYLNRLSDALFVMARYDNHARGLAEPLWDQAV